MAEAMLCGTPVIAFPLGSMKELIIDGETGFLVNDVPEAAEAVHSVGKLSRLRCHQWATERFSQEKMTSDYLKVYEQVLEQKGVRRPGV